MPKSPFKMSHCPHKCINCTFCHCIRASTKERFPPFVTWLMIKSVHVHTCPPPPPLPSFMALICSEVIQISEKTKRNLISTLCLLDGGANLPEHSPELQLAGGCRYTHGCVQVPLSNGKIAGGSNFRMSCCSLQHLIFSQPVGVHV